MIQRSEVFKKSRFVGRRRVVRKEGKGAPNMEKETLKKACESGYDRPKERQ